MSSTKPTTTFGEKMSQGIQKIIDTTGMSNAANKLIDIAYPINNEKNDVLENEEDTFEKPHGGGSLGGRYPFPPNHKATNSGIKIA